MKSLAIALLLAATAAFAAPSADEKPKAAGDDQALVDAARQAKTHRKKSTSRVITNADVKKSKGKVATTNAPTTPVEHEPTLIERYEADRAARLEHDQARAAAQKTVDELQKELAAIEQQYFEEDDLDRRDKEIVKRFASVKARLDAAREELARHTVAEEKPAHIP